jgi:hypothetical protein
MDKLGKYRNLIKDLLINYATPTGDNNNGLDVRPFTEYAVA